MDCVIECYTLWIIRNKIAVVRIADATDTVIFVIVTDWRADDASADELKSHEWNGNRVVLEKTMKTTLILH